MKTPLTKEEWIKKYGGQELLDKEGFEVVPCDDTCTDSVCHGWRVQPVQMKVKHIPYSEGIYAGAKYAVIPNNEFHTMEEMYRDCMKVETQSGRWTPTAPPAWWFFDQDGVLYYTTRDGEFIPLLQYR